MKRMASMARMMALLQGAVILLASPVIGHAQAIYKCQGKSGAMVYTDTPCDNSALAAKGTPGQVVEIPTEQKIATLKNLLIDHRGGDAERYAAENGLSDMLPAVSKAAAREGQQRETQRVLDQQRQLQLRTQAAPRGWPSQVRLSNEENVRLMQQNAVLQHQVVNAQLRVALAEQQAQAAQNAQRKQNTQNLQNTPKVQDAQKARDAARTQAEAEAAKPQVKTPPVIPSTRERCEARDGTVFCH